MFDRAIKVNESSSVFSDANNFFILSLISVIFERKRERIENSAVSYLLTHVCREIVTRLSR